MIAPCTSESAADSDIKWGYAIAGAFALGFAMLIQVAFGELDDESAANLPAIAAVPYAIAGKAGLTIPLGLFGLVLILRDLLRNQDSLFDSASQSAPARKRKTPPTTPKAEEALEVGEPIPDEAPPAPAAGKAPAKKITALEGQFDGRHTTAPASTGGPVGSSDPTPQRPNSGRIELASERFLNKNPGGAFRKGRTNHTGNE